MVAAVVSATGVTPLSAGKPGPAMFHAAALRVHSSKPLAVGDRLDTDIAGGNAAGMDTFQVLTGVSGHFDLLKAIPAERPTFIAESLRDLTGEPDDLRPGAQGGFTAEMDGGVVVLGGGNDVSTDVHALRTALEIAWAEETPVTEVRAVSAAATKALELWW